MMMNILFYFLQKTFMDNYIYFHHLFILITIDFHLSLVHRQNN